MKRDAKKTLQIALLLSVSGVVGVFATFTDHPGIAVLCGTIFLPCLFWLGERSNSLRKGKLELWAKNNNFFPAKAFEPLDEDRIRASLYPIGKGGSPYSIRFRGVFDNREFCMAEIHWHIHVGHARYYKYREVLMIRYGIGNSTNGPSLTYDQMFVPMRWLYASIGYQWIVIWRGNDKFEAISIQDDLAFGVRLAETYEFLRDRGLADSKHPDQYRNKFEFAKHVRKW